MVGILLMGALLVALIKTGGHRMVHHRTNGKRGRNGSPTTYNMIKPQEN